MIKNGDSYRIAQHIHNSYYGTNDIISDEEIVHSGVVARLGSTSSKTAKRIEITGVLGSELVNQTLTLDKLGRYSLSTTEHKYGGRHIQALITPVSSLEKLNILAGSLFMQKLIEIAYAREGAL